MTLIASITGHCWPTVLLVPLMSRGAQIQTPSVFLSNSTARREALRGRRRPTRRGAGAGRACAPPVEARAAPGAAEEVPGEAGASGTAGEGESRPARKDEEGAGGTLPVLCVVPAVPRRHHPQCYTSSTRECERIFAG